MIVIQWFLTLVAIGGVASTAYQWATVGRTQPIQLTIVHVLVQMAWALALIVAVWR